MGVKLPGPPPATGATVVGDTYINVDAPAYAGNIATAVASVTAGTIYLPGSATARTITSTLTLPAKISLMGDGPEASIIDAASTLGAGVYAIDAYPTADGVYHDNSITGIGVRGPSHGTSLTMGTAATNMHGIKLGRRTVIDRCKVEGFNYGVAFGADHAWIRHSHVSGNHFNVAWITSAGRWGDHSLIACDVSGCSMASLYVEDGSMIDSSSIIDTHLGYGPYGIMSASGRVKTEFVTNSIFIDSAFENVGNGMIYGQTSTDIISNDYFHGGSGGAQSNTYRITATTYDYAIQAGTFSNVVFDAAQFFPSTAPALAWVYSTGNSINGLRFRMLTAGVMNSAASGKPILLQANAGAAVLCTWRNQEVSGRFRRTAVALTKGQHAKTTGRDSCDLYGTADTGPSAGFAMHAAGINENVAVATAGYVGQNPIAGAAVAANKFIKPDTGTAGRVIEATSATDGVVVGVSYTSAAGAASTFQVEARTGTWIA